MSKLNALHPVMIVIENTNEHLDAKDYPVNVIKVCYNKGTTFLFLNVLNPDKRTRKWIPIGDGEGGSSGLDELNAEIAARKAADTELSNLITQKVLAEQTARTTALSSEKSAREAADNALETAITTGLDTEASNRQQAINSAKQSLESAIELATTNFNSALATEIADRQSADTTEANARAAADAAEASARTEAITAETTARTEADNKLSTKIATEIADRQSAITATEQKITDAVAVETSARTEAIAATEQKITDAVAAEASARTEAITATEQKITDAVAAETSARTEAITAITNSKSHTVGIETKPDGSKAVKQNEVATMGVGNTEDPLVLKSYIDFLEARLADVEEKLIPRFRIRFFDIPDGNLIATYLVKEGDTSPLPSEDPTREGYAFNGWDVVTPFTPTEDTDIYGKWVRDTFTVTFYNYAGGTVINTQKVKKGQAAVAPVEPTRTGYTFNSWDKSFDNITEDTVVNGTWDIIKLTVTFTDGQGNILKTQEVNYGSSATAPASPTRTEYNFNGWDKSFTNVTTNLTVNAKWKIKTFSVKFYDYNGGTVLKSQTVNYGGAATAPADPTREGYNFLGWDKTFDNITAATNVYGTWEEIPVTGPDLGTIWRTHVKATDPNTTDRKIQETLAAWPYADVLYFDGGAYVDEKFPTAYDGDSDSYTFTDEQLSELATELLIPVGYSAYSEGYNSAHPNANTAAFVAPSSATVDLMCYDPTTSDFTVKTEPMYLYVGTDYTFYYVETGARYKFVVK